MEEGALIKRGLRTLAFNLAGFEPGTFFKTETYKAAPIEGYVGLTYRF